MNNGIIETLVEFAQAKADGAVFEHFTQTHWFGCNLNCEKLSEIEELISARKLRVKPATITLYEYKMFDHIATPPRIFWHHSDKFSFNQAQATGRSIVSAPINEGG